MIEDIAITISKLPCGCCPHGDDSDTCKVLENRCWKMYREEAQLVYDKYVLPMVKENQRVIALLKEYEDVLFKINTCKDYTEAPYMSLLRPCDPPREVCLSVVL